MQNRQHIDDKILEQYHEISEYMEDMDNKITEIVQSHEKDFLVAFRSIMGQVHEEMKKLREISDEEALLAKRNNALADLKGALTWFQDEAVKLSEACSEIQEKYDLHKQRVHALETENIHLEKLVKHYSEENESLKQEFFAKNGENAYSVRSKEESVAQSFQGNSLKEIVDFFQIEDQGFVEMIEKFIEEKAETTKRALEYKLQNKAKQMKKLKIAMANKEKMPLEVGSFEEIFANSVKKVIDEAASRRSKQIPGKYQHLDKSGKFGFTAADKRKIIEEFITQPQVYSIISERLFPEEISKVRLNTS